MDAAQDSRRGRRKPEYMQAELPRYLAADGNAARAVAVLIEPWRENGNAKTTWKHRKQTSADAALGRQPDFVEPTAGIVVHAASSHDAEHRLHVFGRHGPLSGNRMNASVGERRCHAHQIAAGNTDRTLPEVILQNRHGIAIDDAETLEHPGDGPIAESRLALGPVDSLVDDDGVTKERRHDLLDALPFFCRGIAGDQTCRCNCTGIDHRIERS